MDKANEHLQTKVTCPVCGGKVTPDDPCFNCEEGKMKLGDWMQLMLTQASMKLAKDSIAMGRRLLNAAKASGEAEQGWDELAAAEGMTGDQAANSKAGERSTAIFNELAGLETTTIIGILAYVMPQQYQTLQKQLDPTYDPNPAFILTPVKPKASAKPKKGLQPGEDPDVPF